MLGTHTKKYTLGRGEVYLDRFAAGTEVGEGERYVGNTPEFNMTFESEKLPHFNSDEGIREEDDSVELEVTRSASLITDQIVPDNIALFFFGTASTQVQAAGSVVDEAINNVKQDRYYQLGVSTSNPSGVRSVTTVIVTDDSPTPISYTVDVDYKVDLALGRIYIIPGGAITDGKNLEVDYTKEAKSRNRVISGSKAVECALRFIAVNPKGDNIDYFFPKIKITPNGDYNLKGEEWQQIPFSIEILKKTGLEAVYADGRAFTA